MARMGGTRRLCPCAITREAICYQPKTLQATEKCVLLVRRWDGTEVLHVCAAPHRTSHVGRTPAAEAGRGHPLLRSGTTVVGIIVPKWDNGGWHHCPKVGQRWLASLSHPARIPTHSQVRRAAKPRWQTPQVGRTKALGAKVSEKRPGAPNRRAARPSVLRYARVSAQAPRRGAWALRSVE